MCDRHFWLCVPEIGSRTDGCVMQAGKSHRDPNSGLLGLAGFGYACCWWWWWWCGGRGHDIQMDAGIYGTEILLSPWTETDIGRGGARGPHGFGGRGRVASSRSSHEIGLRGTDALGKGAVVPSSKIRAPPGRSVAVTWVRCLPHGQDRNAGLLEQHSGTAFVVVLLSSYSRRCSHSFCAYACAHTSQ